MSHSFIVPLGPSIHVRHQMGQRFNPNREFLFFDPLETSFRSVLDVMKADDIRTIINKESFHIEEITSSRVTISFKGTDHIHNFVDIRPTSAGADTKAFFGKMYHRYERLMFYLKQDQYRLTFTFAGRIEDAEAEEFIAAVRDKYDECKFRLVSLDGAEDELETSVPRFSRIRFTKTGEAVEGDEWKMDHYDWAHVWATIDKLDADEIAAAAALAADKVIEMVPHGGDAENKDQLTDISGSAETVGNESGANGDRVEHVHPVNAAAEHAEHVVQGDGDA
jgi:hypothetical protein